MSSIVFSKAGRVLRQSANLRGLFTHARGRGVHIIRVYKLADKGRPGGFVRVFYAGGDVGETYFVDGDHAAQWAGHYSRMSPRVSWFAGCAVEVWKVDPGKWEYAALRPGLPGESWPVSYGGAA